MIASCCSDNNNGDENRMFNGLTAPLVPTTETGRLLSGFMQNEKELFYEFVEKELEKLRKEAFFTGWEDKWNMKDNWGLTQEKDYIRYVYGSSMLYGYFFKSASLRYHLEKSFDTTSSNLSFSSSRYLKQKSVPLIDTGSTSMSLIKGKKYDNFRSYVANFDNEIMKRGLCWRLLLLVLSFGMQNIT
ncbi:hypothetical protein RDI58_014492 [Solanum bulbocastanum]|uniref:Uncharacterized protein n=1 Tax=Solanum bulbocastanum TaxID=147425 RepID=A0AAN8YB32_SOLBU